MSSAHPGSLQGKLRSTGEAVAVKVQRPGVLETVTVDLFIIRRLGIFLRKFPNITQVGVAAQHCSYLASGPFSPPLPLPPLPCWPRRLLAAGQAAAAPGCPAGRACCCLRATPRVYRAPGAAPGHNLARGGAKHGCRSAPHGMFD